jgi:arabinofuranan 3-O-arabinosyltransferase
VIGTTNQPSKIRRPWYKTGLQKRPEARDQRQISETSKIRLVILSQGQKILRVEDLIFSRRRVSLCAYAFLAANVSALAIRSLAGDWLYDRAGNPAFVDFLQWWIGGHFALLRNAAGVYDFTKFSAAQAAVAKSTPPVAYFHWVYPPTMLLLVAPLARLPYTIAFLTWIVATLSAYAVALYTISPFILSIALALLPLPVVKNVFDGQTAFLMAGLLGLSMAFIGRRPFLSGLCLGVLTYKPQFVLFFPLALVITRQWRVVAGAIIGALLFAGAAALIFGPNVWLLFFKSLKDHNPATLLPANLDGLNQTVFGLMHEAGAGIAAAWAAHLAVALITTALACRIWMRQVPHSLKAAAFSIGVLTVTPYMLAYDLTAFSVPAAFVVTDALTHGFLPGERLALLGCFLALFLCFNFAVGPIVLFALMVLVVRRTRYAIKTPLGSVGAIAI